MLHQPESAAMTIHLPADKDVFTTGEVAKMFGFSAQTVNKLVDSGRIKGFRIPGSTHRRVPLASVIQLAKEQGFAIVDPRAEGNGDGTIECNSSFDLACVLHEKRESVQRVMLPHSAAHTEQLQRELRRRVQDWCTKQDIAPPDLIFAESVEEERQSA